MNKNGLNKHIAKESHKDVEPFIAPLIGDVRVGDFSMDSLVINPLGEISYTKCNHKWKKYTGLSKSFTYCEVCDEKK